MTCLADLSAVEAWKPAMPWPSYSENLETPPSIIFAHWATKKHLGLVKGWLTLRAADCRFQNGRSTVITTVVCIINTVPLQNGAFSHYCFLFPVTLPQIKVFVFLHIRT